MSQPSKKPNNPRLQKAPRSGSRKSRSPKKSPSQTSLLLKGVLVGLECLGLLGIGMSAVIVLLGYSANRFSGTGLLKSYLPFAAAITGLVLVGAVSLFLWMGSRRKFLARSFFLPPAIVLCVALVIATLAPPKFFTRAFLYYRVLIGGKEEAGRAALAHQVYAAYRRLDIDGLAKMMTQADGYAAPIEEAGAAYGIDADLLMGLAAVESSFQPRASSDGGQGLFQITQPPAAALKAARRSIAREQQDLTNPRINAHLGAATLQHYLNEMGGDLFLGLLAYNIGPANGGLRFIMSQYGATDFITIQPYLLQLPRDYPIRVLSYALAFRIKRREGRVLPYEEGTNALRIQMNGIPGLE